MRGMMETATFSALLREKTFAAFEIGQSPGHLSGLCLELLSEQKREWPDCRQGYESLKHIRARDIRCKGFTVRLQYNPGRIKSTLANVRGKHVKERPCFLCLNNLPVAQKGILYREDYLILCNPAPVFPAHFTICHVDHRPQAIDKNIDTLLELIRDFGDRWTILYNGPKCGASAPDHLHLQAVPAGQMPIEKEIIGEKKVTRISQIDGVQLSRGSALGREVIILEGDDPMAVAKAFKGFLAALKQMLLTDSSGQAREPMLNIAGFFKEGKWHILVFPRVKHRPDAFFMEGDDRIVISPAVVEMGGILVTPMERDFERLDASIVEAIYREVSLEVACPCTSGVPPR